MERADYTRNLNTTAYVQRGAENPGTGWMLFAAAIIGLAAVRETLRMIGKSPIVVQIRNASPLERGIAAMTLEQALQRLGSGVLRGGPSQQRGLPPAPLASVVSSRRR